eukprot:TRINITY_DN1287_c0_g1_i2.p1 TRINITY_DN1287_c0_g1~~TRINITY_DN1287_c0_g1_i2.p1  ORF type:complete len:106 (-),score=9.85 TRINITY_DN1287_c0_g1_i2:296-613(-)
MLSKLKSGGTWMIVGIGTLAWSCSVVNFSFLFLLLGVAFLLSLGGGFFAVLFFPVIHPSFSSCSSRCHYRLHNHTHHMLFFSSLYYSFYQQSLLLLTTPPEMLIP